jgi:conjugative transfer signal peptidase TraF
MGCGLSLTLAASLIDRSDFVWNRTESVPNGLYCIDRSASVSKGDLVAFEPSDEVRRWLYQEGILGSDWPLLKHIAGLEGDGICRCGVQVFINELHVADALETTGSGSPLPAWQGCQTLRSDEVFLLNDHPRSVDGRYFGVQDRARILGVARPIWTYGKRPAEYQAGVKALESVSGEASVSRSAVVTPPAPCRESGLDGIGYDGGFHEGRQL